MLKYLPYKTRPYHYPKHVINNYFPKWMSFTRSETDPMHAFLDISINYYDEIIRDYLYDISNKVLMTRADLNEPDHYYSIVLEQKIKDDITSKITAYRNGSTVNLYYCESEDLFLSKLFTDLDIENIKDITGDLELSNVKCRGMAYFIKNFNAYTPYLACLISGIYYREYKVVPNYETGILSDYSFEKESETIINELYIKDEAQEPLSGIPDASGLYLKLTAEPSEFIELRDVTFPDLNGNNYIVVSPDEYSISGVYVLLSGVRPSYNSIYYISGLPGEQPDAGWHGSYEAYYKTKVFDDSVDICYKGKLHEIYACNSGFFPLTTERQQSTYLFWDYANSIEDGIIYLVLDRDMVRPDTIVEISGFTYNTFTEVYDNYVTSGIITREINFTPGVLLDTELSISGVVLYKDSTPITPAISNIENYITIDIVKDTENGYFGYIISISGIPEFYKFNKVVFSPKIYYTFERNVMSSYSITGYVYAKDDFKISYNINTKEYEILALPVVQLLDINDEYDYLYPIKGGIINDYNKKYKNIQLKTSYTIGGIDYDRYYNGIISLNTTDDTLIIRTDNNEMSKVYLNVDPTVKTFDMKKYGYQKPLVLNSLEKSNPNIKFISLYIYYDFIILLYVKRIRRGELYSYSLYLTIVNKFFETNKIYYDLDENYIQVMSLPSSFGEKLFNEDRNVFVDMCIMQDNKLLLMFNNESITTVYTIPLKFDYYMIDKTYNKLIFREQYDKIVIED